MTVLQPGIERVQALADISRSRYVVIATKPVHRLHIRPTVHRGTPFIPGPCSSVGYSEGQTDTKTRVTTIHFASSTTHAKC